MVDFGTVFIVGVSCAVTAMVMHSRSLEKYNDLNTRFTKLCALYEQTQERRNYFRDTCEKLVIEVERLQAVEYFYKQGIKVNLFPRGCDRREVYKRLMNIYHPDKPNGCRKMSQEIQRQFKK